MIHFLTSLWLRHIHPRLTFLIATIGILGLIICLLILFIVTKLSTEVLEKEAFAFDTLVLLWIHQFANQNLARVMLTITQLGNPNFVITLASISLGLLWWRRCYPETMIFVIACLSALIFNTGLKLFFSKLRPQLWQPLIKETSFSFPSGYALGALILYGLLASLLAFYHPTLSTLIYLIAVILIVAIGFSRLYLRVHWMTDIIAGYGVCFLWLISCITMLKLPRSEQG